MKVERCRVEMEHMPSRSVLRQVWVDLKTGNVVLTTKAEVETPPR